MKTQSKLFRLQNERFLPLVNEALLGSLHRQQSIFYVDSNTGSDSYSGTDIRSPLATIAEAVSKCTADRGDTIIVLPHHAETVTAAIDLNKAGIQLIGLKVGNRRATITGNGTIDVIDVSSDDCLIAGLKFAAPETDAQTADINIDAANCSVVDTVHIGSQTSKNKVDIITLTANADDALLDGVKIYNTVVEVVGGIVLEGACARVEIRNCFVFDSIGFTNGAISDEATATALNIHHNTFSNAKADTVVMEFGNNSSGVCAYNNVNGRHTTIASNVTPGTGMAFFQNFAVEEAAKNGIVIPVADAD